jgi:hypothetical protein
MKSSLLSPSKSLDGIAGWGNKTIPAIISYVSSSGWIEPRQIFDRPLAA